MPSIILVTVRYALDGVVDIIGDVIVEDDSKDDVDEKISLDVLLVDRILLVLVTSLSVSEIVPLVEA